MIDIQWEQLKARALAQGFDAAAPLDCATIALHQDVRAACAVNRCGRYGKSWSCPPACGTLDECADRLRRYSRGLLVQTVGRLEDEFDSEGMVETARRHNENFRTFANLLREEFPDLLPVGTESCANCKQCTYPDAPCRNPFGASIPMEAFGMLVHEVCQRNGMEYYHGKGTLTFTGCFLLE